MIPVVSFIVGLIAVQFALKYLLLYSVIRRDMFTRENVADGRTLGRDKSLTRSLLAAMFIKDLWFTVITGSAL
jgi:hypothetical protein